jgi:hypothetical protein
LTAFSFNCHFKMVQSLFWVVGGIRIKSAPPLPLIVEVAPGVINSGVHKIILLDGILPQQIILEIGDVLKSKFRQKGIV